MADKIRIFALGGLDEIGKNMTAIEINGELFIADAGLKIPDSSVPGIDNIIPDYTYLKENKERIKAFIITHGHDDQMGALPYVYKDIQAPIYATKPTIAMITALTTKLKLDNKYLFRAIEPSSLVTIGNRKVQFFQTAHSIMGSCGFAIETDQGYIVYSGDFIVEYNINQMFKHDLNALAKIAEKDVLILMSESSNADKPGYTSPTHRITPHLLRPFQEAKGKIFVALYTNSIYNLTETIRLAVAMKKKIIFYKNKETQDLVGTLNSLGEPLVNKASLGTVEDILRIRTQDIVVILLGHREDLFHEIEMLGTGECEDRLVRLNPQDTFIVAAPPVNGIETMATAAIDELYRTGAQILNISRKMLASMHAQEEDLKTMISLLKPKYYLPLRGEYRHLLANAKVALGMNMNYSHLNTFILDNGMILAIESGKAKVLESSIHVGDLMVDGIGVGDVGGAVIDDRQKLSDDGVIIMALAISRVDKKIVAGPDIQMRGFMFVKDSEVLLKELTRILIDNVESCLASGQRLEEIKSLVHEKALRSVRKETGKDPMILPLIVEIN